VLNRLAMVGVTHRVAPLPLLERMSVPRGARPELLAALQKAGYPEAVLLSTCSRTEVYSGPSQRAPDGLLEVLAQQVGVPLHELARVAEIRTGQAGVEHLLRVTAGLDSRVIGEVEIHGQVRTAFRDALAAGMTGSSLSPLFAAALRCGHQVREDTTLGAQGRSLARQAVEIGLATLGSVADPAIMVVGAGRMASTAVEHLTHLGRRPQVAARNEAHAARLAGPGQVCPLPALASGIAQADLLICATSAAHDVVTLTHVREAMTARTRPLTIVDLSVPRNVDVEVGAVRGVHLIDLEGMNDDATTDPELAAALDAGTRIVDAAVARYVESLAARRAGPVIAALRERVEQTCLQELAKVAAPRLVEHDDLVRAAHAVAGKLLHGPTIAARAAAAAGDTHALIVLCDTFGIGLGELGLDDPTAVA
jgi:glutamyl-tRNA reductase